MKTVFTDRSTIAHLWANQKQSEARNSGDNFYFRGKTIYSYGSHFPIAKHVKNDKGESGVLFTLRSYSNTTAKHVSIVRSAATHLNRIYCCNPENSHGQNFEYWERQIVSEAANLPKAKKPEKYLSAIAANFAQAEKYAEFFGVNIPESLQSAANIQNKAEYLAYNEAKVKAEKEAEIKRQKDAAKAHKKALTEWISGKGCRLFSHNGQDYLRLNDGHVETSQGVKIPISEAQKMYQSLNGGNTGEIRTNSGTYAFMFDGKVLTAGCHNITKVEISRFAKVAGWQ